jgi:hypothetical protein
MAKKPEPPQELTAWSVYKIAKKAMWLGSEAHRHHRPISEPNALPTHPPGRYHSLVLRL